GARGVYGISSERRLLEEVRMHLAYRWFTRLGFEQELPDHSTFSKNRHGRFRESGIFRDIFALVFIRFGETYTEHQQQFSVVVQGGGGSVRVREALPLLCRLHGGLLSMPDQILARKPCQIGIERRDLERHLVMRREQADGLDVHHRQAITP